MKAYRVLGSFVGFFIILFNLTSMVACKQQVCCTYTDGDGDTYQACEGDSHVTLFYADGGSYTYNLYNELTGAYWNYYQAQFLAYGGSCS